MQRFHRQFSTQKYQNLGKYIQSCLPKYVQQIQIYKDELTINVNPVGIKPTLEFLKLHQNTLFNQLVDLTCVDYPFKEKRFELVYLLLSLPNNCRLKVKSYSSEIDQIESVTSVFKGADWMEREVYDMYGVYFKNHPDLRRILTDYGFFNI